MVEKNNFTLLENFLYYSHVTFNLRIIQYCPIMYIFYCDIIYSVLPFVSKRMSPCVKRRSISRRRLFTLAGLCSSVQSLSHVWLFETPWIIARQASLSNTNSRSSLKLTSIESVMPSSHLSLCRPLLLLPPIPPSIRVFSNESNSSNEVAKVLDFQLQHHSFQRTPRTDFL